ncbi:MAG: Ppx/GppA phosphatase family protein [Acidobacteriota bacterium]|nr:Ppx/GppA family phosphatase [Blastocatellia bacterium]MDW8412567.1 Ppx/GppA phosphatase family protein [Acidobacteriota bacterium]
MRLAAIDIGSNSIHLVLVEVESGGRFNILAREKEMVRLAAGAMSTHHLSRSRIESALEVIARYVSFSRARGAEQILATATSAVREASNRNYFVERVRALTGVNVEILSGVEEARLISLAVAEAMHLERRKALIIDIGGGSTEFIVTDGRQPLLLRSMRLGAVRLAEQERLSDPVKKKELARMRANLRADLARTAQEIIELGYDIVIGTSGTILNLVALATRLQSQRSEQAFANFSATASLEQIEQINERLAKMTERERRAVPGLDPDRADIIVPGGQILEAILRSVGARAITTCDWALREGILLDYIAKHADLPHADLGLVTDEKVLDVRDKSILALARRYEYQPVHAHQVAKLAGQLFDGMKTLHCLSDEDRVLLQYAAILHDIGYHISHTGHHRHGYYMIQNAELPGFSSSEAALVAALVRFHRGARPSKTKHPEYAALPKKDRQRVLKLSALLRLADGLDRSHRAIVDKVVPKKLGRGWEIEIYSQQDCELEMWYAGRMIKYFERIFGTKLYLVRSEPQPPNSDYIDDKGCSGSTISDSGLVEAALSRSS